jgi:hypothetical protein
VDYSDRKGDWIITASGGRFYPLDPRPEDISIKDIAHALSMLNRFTGHTNWPYSVAQHCVLASYLVPEDQKLGALLHDASEAYVNDVARPVKRYIADYQAIENKILDVIELKFGVNTRTPDIKYADTQMLVTEARVLCNGEGWWKDDQYPDPVDWPVVYDWGSWYSTKDRYLNRFYELAKTYPWEVNHGKYK